MAKTENLPEVKEAAGLPVVVDFGNNAGAGFEEADSSCYAIPFLRMLQATSDQTKRVNPLYIKGAEEGDFYNTVTEEVTKGENGVVLIPVAFKHKYNRWVPNRGGYRGSWTPSEYATNQKQRITISTQNGPQEIEADMEGNQLVDSREHYCLLVRPDGSTDMVLVALTGTQMKKSKKWMTLMDGICRPKGLPMYSQMFKATPTPESNDKGSWAGWKIDHFAQVSSQEMVQAAMLFSSMVRSGQVEAAQTDDDLPF